MHRADFNINRLPVDLQTNFRKLYANPTTQNAAIQNFLLPNEVYCGDAREMLGLIEPNSISLGF